MYCEDVDLNWRLQLAGRGSVFAPGARIYHHLSATGGGEFASYWVGRNLLLILAKDVPLRLLLRPRAAHRGDLCRAGVAGGAQLARGGGAGDAARDGGGGPGVAALLAQRRMCWRRGMRRMWGGSRLLLRPRRGR
ncbi:MAG: hypothetical protein U0841_22920 [Chloroflexia bacterium]